tara:strand:- start:76 stop:675 length:600 start_codon:yes stop_codon:yes gene_type:complete
MKLWKYKSYDEYVRVQVNGNASKLTNVWADESCIDYICNFARNPDGVTIKQPPQHVICHGTRNGSEQKWFIKNLPDAAVIGTEISHTANEFPNTIQHDFHVPIEEYVNKFDILYSNSLDHSYDPMKCLRTWIDQINTDGLLCIDLAQGQEMISRELDPLEITSEELIDLLINKFSLKLVERKVIDRKRGVNSELLIFKK